MSGQRSNKWDLAYRTANVFLLYIIVVLFGVNTWELGVPNFESIKPKWQTPPVKDKTMIPVLQQDSGSRPPPGCRKRNLRSLSSHACSTRPAATINPQTKAFALPALCGTLTLQGIRSSFCCLCSHCLLFISKTFGGREFLHHHRKIRFYAWIHGHNQFQLD